MRKVYKALTSDQKDRKVIFSSELIGGGIIHEVMADDPDKHRKITRLVDDKFFNGSPYKRNEIHQ